jgi:ribonuclease VapC
MIIDSSVIVAILRDEPELDLFTKAIQNADTRRMSAASYVEAAIVIDAGRSPVASRRFDQLVRASGIIIEPVTERQAGIAREAYRDFGKGSGHPAKLNFGDCFAYALAIDLNEPLLFKGDDFRPTDVKVAL